VRTKTLDLTVDEINLALSRLTRLGLLDMVAADRWVAVSGANVSGSDGFAQQVIRRLSEQVRQLSGAKVEDAMDGTTEPAATRIEINARQLPAVTELIERLQREAAVLQRDEKEYQLEIKLATISQNPKSKEQ